MEAVTDTPIARQDMQRFLEQALEKLYVKDNTYSVYADRNDDWSELAKELYESDLPLTLESMTDMFYENLYELYYTELPSNVRVEIQETLRELIERDGRYDDVDYDDQLSEEMDNVEENLEFDFSDVTSNFEYYLDQLYDDSAIKNLEELSWFRNTDISLNELQDVTLVGTATEVAQYFRKQLIIENTASEIIELYSAEVAGYVPDYDEDDEDAEIAVARELLPLIPDDTFADVIADYIPDTYITKLNDGIHYGVLYD